MHSVNKLCKHEKLTSCTQGESVETKALILTVTTCVLSQHWRFNSQSVLKTSNFLKLKSAKWSRKYDDGICWENDR